MTEEAEALLPVPFDDDTMRTRIIHYVRRLYSLDTLDTRFTTSARSRPSTRSSKEQADGAATAAFAGNESLAALNLYAGSNNHSRFVPATKPSKWKTPEFFIYYLIFLVVVPWMLKTGYDISKESHPNYHRFESLLSPGWLFGRKVDNSDSQYASFRNYLPILLCLLAVHPVLRRIYERAYSKTGNYGPYTPIDAQAHTHGLPSVPIEGQIRLRRRISFDVIFAVIFLTVLHGISVFKIFFIISTNYFIVKHIPRSKIPLFSWVFNIGILFANEFCRGYRFADLAWFLSPQRVFETQEAANQAYWGSWGAWLDHTYGGLMPRWEVSFNITMLRLISFDLDYYWSLDPELSILLEKKPPTPGPLSERQRIAIPPASKYFNIFPYFSYILYTPLYLAGPILTFNDYIYQLHAPLSSVNVQRIVMYALRFFVTLLCMEFLLHFIYVVAICKAKPTWEAYTSFQLSMLGYFNLHIIWLKLLLPWRFFRLWALCDGIDPPENMVRCMSNNYSAAAFWRGWHRSFNRWTVRYIYIPLGGSGSRIPSQTRPSWLRLLMEKVKTVRNFLIVFTFVALWHDINLRLLMWGWLITLFVLPEILCRMLLPPSLPVFRAHPDLYRVLCGIGAVGNIIMMMSANLVGFAIGWDGVKGMAQGIIGGYAGWAFFVAAAMTMFVGAQMMFEIRESERREGIFMKC